MISAEDAFERMGADVMRWIFCQQPPNLDLWFGFGPGNEVKRRLLTLWNSVSFFIQYANLADFTPSPDAASTKDLDAWAAALTDRFVSDATEGYESYLTSDVLRAYGVYLDDLSNWYIRRSRRRFWEGDREALQTLWSCLTRSLQAVAPILPFITDYLWRALTPGGRATAASIFLVGWPEQRPFDADLLTEMEKVRQVVNLGHQCRGAARMRVRQPLRRMVIEGADKVAPYLDMIADELRIKTVETGTVRADRVVVRPNLKELGPRLGSRLPGLRAQLRNGEFEELPGGRFRVGDLELEPSDVLVERSGADGWQLAGFDGVTVALDLEIDDDLQLESRVYDLIRAVNGLRKDTGLQISDRIKLRLPAVDKELLRYHEWIKDETLAISVTASGDKIEVESVDHAEPRSS
jgi:isoleucyl-tRNA synthetase